MAALERDSGSEASGRPEQPVGAPLPDWEPRPLPPHTPLQGRWCRLEPLDPARHAADLHAANAADGEGRMWTYMTYGPFGSLADYRAHLDRLARWEGRQFYAILDAADGRALGTAAFVRMQPAVGVIEVGHVVFSPALQRTRVASEAMYLMARRVFEEAGYRRYEWRSDRLHHDALAAAERLGFRAEAAFRQDSLYKGRNRDTVWCALLDRDWPALKAVFEAWLDPANFDSAGRQRQCLSRLTATLPGLLEPRFGAAADHEVELPGEAFRPYRGDSLSRREGSPMTASPAPAPRLNDLGQPIGAPLPDWTRRPRPPRTVMQGRWCRVEPLDPARHAESLHAANSEDREGRNWTYLTTGPFASLADYRAWAEEAAAGEDPLFHAVVDAESGRALGVASYLRIQPELGVIEVGHINFAPPLQRSRLATESLYLMMARAFDELGYRRYEWKCDALNAPSRRAAERLGFRYEGTFRQAMIYRRRNRDTAWFSIVDSEWPAVKAAFQAWLDPANFDAEGRQRRRLEELRGG